MSITPELLAILRCPETKEELVYFPNGLAEDARPFLLCPASRLRYPVDENGVPVMLVDEAERLDTSACDALVARARELGLSVPAGAAAE